MIPLPPYMGTISSEYGVTAFPFGEGREFFGQMGREFNGVTAFPFGDRVVIAGHCPYIQIIKPSLWEGKRFILLWEYPFLCRVRIILTRIRTSWKPDFFVCFTNKRKITRSYRISYCVTGS